jgi:ankyrin repeat protein
MTPLISAIRRNHRNIATVLINHPKIIIQQVIKYDSDPTSLKETTALSEAIKYQNTPIINLLIQKGADPTRALHM